MNTGNTDLKTAAELLCKWDNILILIHAKPDGDAVGSGFAMLGMLCGMGKNARLICADGLAEKFECITSGNYPENACFSNNPDEISAFLAGFNVEHTVSADIAAPYLLGNNEKYAKDIELCIDHHEINTITAPHTVIFPDASAAGEVIADLAEEISAIVEKNVLTSGVAGALYCAIASDTGSFRYANATSKAYMTAARLKQAGADSEEICRQLFESRTYPSYKVLGKVISNTKLYCDGRLSVSTIRQSELRELGADDMDVEGSSGVVREIAGVQIGILARENSSGMCKLSLRSNCDINVAEICRHFGGGGHAKAAGCSLQGNFEESLESVIQYVSGVLG